MQICIINLLKITKKISILDLKEEKNEISNFNHILSARSSHSY
jgi:hypothetical protein